MYLNLLYNAQDGVGRITLNRATKRNALNDELIQALKAAIAQAIDETDTHVLLLQGAGGDFCSGADLSALREAQNADVLTNLRDAERLAALFRQMRECPKPIVAAVHGRALAGGCGLASACDIVLASDSAKFGYPEVNIGFVPAMVMAMLRRAMSEKAAFELAVGGETIDAKRAHELGLVQRVYPDTSFAEDVTAYTAKLASKPTSAMMLTKRLLYQMDSVGFNTALEAGVEMNAIARMTDDCRRGVERFLNKKTD